MMHKHSIRPCAVFLLDICALVARSVLVLGLRAEKEVAEDPDKEDVDRWMTLDDASNIINNIKMDERAY